MHVSYGELIRISPESIRMVGFTYGQADDAVEGIVWTQCVTGRGYQLLRMASREKPAGGWPPHSIEETPGFCRLAFERVPAFAFAARLADLAQSEARNGGAVLATGVFGGWIAPYIAFRLGRAGLHAAVLWRRGEPAIEEDSPDMLFGVAAAQDVLAVAPKAPDSASIASGTISKRTLERLRRSPGSPGCGSLIVVANRDAASEVQIDFGEAASALGLAGTSTLAAGDRFRRAVADGIDVAAQEHRVLTGLAQRIRLPNSERSRGQAG